MQLFEELHFKFCIVVSNEKSYDFLNLTEKKENENYFNKNNFLFVLNK